MTASDLLRRLHEHRQWANGRILSSVRALSTEQLMQPSAIGQGSVWRTLTHLYAAEYVWLEALLGNSEPLLPGDLPGKLPGNQQGHDALQSLEHLVTNWQTLDQRWREYLLQLTDETLDEVVYKTSTSSGYGRRHGTSCADVLLHVCTHAQYTTAQLVNMLRHLGDEQLPDTMLITMARNTSEP